MSNYWMTIIICFEYRENQEINNGTECQSESISLEFKP